MFYVAVFGFIGGIFFRSLFPLDPFFLYAPALIFIVCAVLFRHVRYLGYIACAAIFIFLGAMRFAASDYVARGDDFSRIASYTGNSVTFEGVIGGEPDIRDRSIFYTMERLRVLIRDNERAVSGRVLLTTSLYPRLVFGDRVRTTCVLDDPKELGESYRGYLAKSGVYAICRYPKSVELISQNEGNVLKRWLLGIRNNFRVQTQKIFPFPHAGLVLGLLIGDTDGIPNYLKDALIQTGTIHIVAISGYNISIIISLLLTLAPYIYLSRRFAWAAVIPILLGFIFIAGAESSVVRAGIMALIVAFASEAGRLSNCSRVLAITAFLMLAKNPYLLVFDVGFQLSFAATLGLVYISPRISDWLKARFPFRFIAETAAVTLGANMAVAPILLLHFGRVSFIAPFVNIAIIWIIPLAMALGFSAVLISYMFLPLGKVASWFSWATLEYVIRAVEFFA